MAIAVYREAGFFSRQLCDSVRSAMDAGQVEGAEVLGPSTHADLGARRALIVEPGPEVVAHVESRLDDRRERIASSLGIVLDVREGPGFIRYLPGGFYRPHRDRSDHSDWPEAARRAVAIVVFLNSSRALVTNGEFDGGVLKLFSADGPIDVVPEAGLLVAFPAGVLHEVTEVRSGTRDAIVDWFYGTPEGVPYAT